ncbi:hypothetical protein PtB15_3B278 [Puccinia triticina]|nr:hypothetical protein PtB15_3B278 [Puccinia triticina]
MSARKPSLPLPRAPNSHPVCPLAHPFSPQLLYDLIGSMEHKDNKIRKPVPKHAPHCA